ncbi:methyltransferase domain-containing protein [Streptomyces sp. NPDC059373]
MNVAGGYLQAWESFWRDVPDEPGAAFWDSEAEVTAAGHLPLFEGYVDDTLPLVDLGCGNGTQTRFLAGRYGRVVGVDLAAAAIERARRADPGGLAEYRQLNGADAEAVRALHAELGDANVYMRGVLHQCEPDERGPLVEGIAELLGVRGRAFADELAGAAKGVLMGLAQQPGGPPAKLAAVFAHGIAPGEVPDEAIPGFFRSAGLDVLEQGALPLTTTEYAADGTRIQVPTNWLVAGRRG